MAVAAFQARRGDQALLQGEGSSVQLSSAHPRDHPPHHKHPTFLISGSVGGLYPGDSTSLTLTVSNPLRFRIVVGSIKIAVESPRPGCSSSYLTVASFSGHLSIRAHRSGQVSVAVNLAHAAPDRCQGVHFGLEYHGLAQKG
jgi:hypothetical protein